MRYKFIAAFTIGNARTQQPMEYDQKDIIATLNRRLKTAFPSATNIEITEDKSEQTPKGVK